MMRASGREHGARGTPPRGADLLDPGRPLPLDSAVPLPDHGA